MIILLGGAAKRSGTNFCVICDSARRAGWAPLKKYHKSSVITVHIHERVNNKYFAQTVHDFTGVELGQIYTVSLFSISDENFYQVSQNWPNDFSTRWAWPACSTRGSSTAAPPSSPPLHLPSSSGTRWGSENTFVLLTFINITSKMTQSCQVYTQMGVARSWRESREECRFVAIQEEVFLWFLVNVMIPGLGQVTWSAWEIRVKKHRYVPLPRSLPLLTPLPRLMSLQYLQVLGSVGASDIWTGGNMCPDRSATIISIHVKYIELPLSNKWQNFWNNFTSFANLVGWHHSSARHPRTRCGRTGAPTRTQTLPRTPGLRRTTAVSRWRLWRRRRWSASWWSGGSSRLAGRILLLAFARRLWVWRHWGTSCRSRNFGCWGDSPSWSSLIWRVGVGGCQSKTFQHSGRPWSSSCAMGQSWLGLGAFLLDWWAQPPLNNATTSLLSFQWPAASWDLSPAHLPPPWTSPPPHQPQLLASQRPWSRRQSGWSSKA